MKLLKFIPSALIPLSLLASTAKAQDYRKEIVDNASILYPTNGAMRSQYISLENVSAKLFTDFHSNHEFSNKIITQIKTFCIKKHPYSMQRRLEEMQTQLASYKSYKNELWAKGVDDKAKNKIMTIASILMGEDYEMKYSWALAEAQAYKALALLSSDTTQAQKKWPNSYQSQILEIVNLHPGTPMPTKSPKQHVILQFVGNK